MKVRSSADFCNPLQRGGARFFRVGQDDFRHGELQSMERSAGESMREAVGCNRSTPDSADYSRGWGALRVYAIGVENYWFDELQSMESSAGRGGWITAAAGHGAGEAAASGVARVGGGVVEDSAAGDDAAGSHAATAFYHSAVLAGCLWEQRQPRREPLSALASFGGDSSDLP